MPGVLNRGGMFKPIPKGAVLIARPSRWGNPFKIGIDGTRQEVIEKYRLWLLDNKELLSLLGELRGKDLVCYCHTWDGQGTNPMYCHGDILLELANK